MKTLLLVLFAVSLSFALSTDARVRVGTLSGTVLNARGRPVAGAAVTIQTSDGMEPFGAHTDTAGRFRIARLETGQYDLRASSAGLLSKWTKRVMVHENKTTVVLIQLPAEKR